MVRRFRLLPEESSLSWLPYAWLVYLLGVPIGAYYGRESSAQWAVTLAGMALFLVLYFRGYWVEGARLAGIIAIEVALGLYFARHNGGAICYFVYAACLIAWVGPAKTAYRYLLLFLVVLAAALLATHFRWELAVPALVFSTLLGAVTIRQAEMKRTLAALRLAHEEIARIAKVAERERIARDLHDVLGHTLSVIVLKSELAAKLADRDIERATAEIRDVERIARESLGELREAVAGYRAESIGAEFVRARNVLETAGVDVKCDAESLPLTPLQESVLALAVREGVTNIVRHAQAHSAHFALRSAGDSYRLEIADDGRGASAAEGSGLAGMRQRVEALGGTLVREVAGGTRLILTLPAGAESR
jgi:two-component system sensor histidine kinase DesK